MNREIKLQLIYDRTGELSTPMPHGVKATPNPYIFTISTGDLQGVLTKLSWGVNNKYWKLRVIREFTGLHDKNGKEIYEGDIIISHGYIRHAGGKEDKPPYKFEVTFDECCDHDGNGTLGWNLDPYELDYEVIGNIYENPELLEAVE